jgi:hypothetical protein
LEHRQYYAAQTESERTEYIIGRLAAADNHKTPPTYLFSMEGHTICNAAFRYVTGFSKNKLQTAKTTYLAGGRRSIHGLSGTKNPQQITLNAHVWLAGFFESIGDKMPQGQIHLPVSMSWTEVYKRFCSQQPVDVPLLGASTFHALIARSFSHVKCPRAGRLGKCMDCLAFNERKLSCKSDAGVSQIIMEKKAHLTIVQQDRLAYQTQRDLAKSTHKFIWSCIIDYSQPVMMPTHYPVPKNWLRYGNRYILSVGGLIDHSTGNHFYFHPKGFWPKDPNLIISILYTHLSNRFAALPIGEKPHTLYLQADNCAAENKNWVLLAFLSLLVAKNFFQDIYLNFHIVGHTHEDVDCLFSPLQSKIKQSSVHTPR